ncbi:putative two-component system sensor histidine kinase [Sphingobacterium deserti]|uniref:Putative two-component system sensor histidine kinase n=2 Tax=Sphingobacterium deserti TaxID=1229276 RepID=A0A0B8SZ81_9SPHI|nr:putative two-component system sensor histidine kinase [Sphingobacterium deserti]
MRNNYLRFRSKILPVLHVTSWIIYLYFSFHLNESKFGTGLLSIVLFPLYAVTFYSFYYCLNLFFDHRKPLLSGCGFFLLILLIIPLTYCYINIFLARIGLEVQDHSVPFRWSEFALSTYLGTFRITMFAGLVFLICSVLKSNRLLAILRMQNRDLKFSRLSTQLTSHTQFDLLHKLLAKFTGIGADFERYVEQLAGMHEYTATGVDRKLVPLAVELEQMESLAAMYSEAYFTSKADWLTIHGDISEFFVPPMVLVSLFENILKHSDFTKADSISIKIRAFENTLLISSENYIGKTVSSHSMGIGNNNLKARLELIFEENVIYTTCVREGRYVTSITIHYS